MKTLQRLQDARECEEKTIDALSRILTRTEKGIDKLAQKVKNSEIVATVSGAVGCVSAYLFASTDDFNVMVAKNGIDVFTTTEGMIMGGITAAGFAIAGGALLYRAYQNQKLEDKVDKAEYLEDQIAEHQDNIEKIDARILYNDGGDMALRNVSEETGVPFERFKNPYANEENQVSSGNDIFAKGVSEANITPEE